MVEGLKRRTLYKLYIKEKRSLREIAKMFGCSRTTIQEKCRQYGIKLRPLNMLRIEVKKSVLQKLYVKEGKSSHKIAVTLSCSPETVLKRCNKYSIPLRNPGSKRIEIDKPTLRRLYIEDRKSITKIAKICSCSKSTISKRVKQFGLRKEMEGGKFLSY